MDISKRLTEVDEILNYLSAEELNKIPEDIRAIIYENKDSEYVWTYDISKTLQEQDVPAETISILSYLNTEYLLNDNQKEIMSQIYAIADKEIEKRKNKEYSPVFLNKKNTN